MKKIILTLFLVFGMLCFWRYFSSEVPKNAHIGASPQYANVKNGETGALSVSNESRKLKPSEIINDISNTTRNQKVVEHLQRFEQRTAGITKELIKKEQEQIKLGLHAALEQESSRPDITIERDQNGQQWEVLSFDNGITRYLPRN